MTEYGPFGASRISPARPACNPVRPGKLGLFGLGSLGRGDAASKIMQRRRGFRIAP